MTDQNEPPRQVRPVERHGEEKAERRHRAVDGGWLYAALGLVDLEPANVLGRRRIRRPPEEGGEAAHITDVVALRLRSQATHRHVFEHALSQSTDRVFDR
jgi:hypothetical protein